MPKHIQTKHKKRMFPFAFYDELQAGLTQYVFHNPAFIADYERKRQNKQGLDREKREEIFSANQHNPIMEQLDKNNILDVEPFGEVLTLDMCLATSDVSTYIKEPLKRSQIPIRLLVAQLYDSSEKPVFSKDVTEESIAQIPEVLWDDPNLFLGIISLGQSTDEQSEEPAVGVIRIPPFLEAKILESKE